MDLHSLVANRGLDHIGLNIFSYLDPSSLAQCRLVAKPWSNLITNSQIWSTAICDKFDFFQSKTVKSEKRPRVERNIKRWKFWEPLIQTFRNDNANGLGQLYVFFNEGFPFKDDVTNFRNAYEPFTEEDIFDEVFEALEQNIQRHGEDLFNKIFPILYLKDLKKDFAGTCYEAAIKGLPTLLDTLLTKAADEGIDVFAKIKTQEGTFLQQMLKNYNVKGQTVEVCKILLQHMPGRDEVFTIESDPCVRDDWLIREEMKSFGSLSNRVLPRYRKRFHKDGIISAKSVKDHNDDSLVEQVKNLSTLHLACCANRSKVDDRLSDFQKREKVQELKKERFWECFASEDSTRAKIVTMILEQTAIDVNAIDDIGRTALHYAVQFYDIEVVKSLVNHPNIAIDVEDARGQTPFAYACAYGKIRVVKLLYETDQTLANRVHENDDLMTPLHYSLFWKTPNVETLQFILSLPNIDVNAKTGKYGHTPLHLACNMTYCKDYSLANHLVEVPEIDINARGIDGITTPLDIAKTTFENLKAFPRYFNVMEIQEIEELEQKFTTLLVHLGAESNDIRPTALVMESDSGYEISGSQGDDDDIDTDEEMVELYF